jgi:hypothetical protein
MAGKRLNGKPPVNKWGKSDRSSCMAKEVSSIHVKGLRDGIFLIIAQKA